MTVISVSDQVMAVLRASNIPLPASVVAIRSGCSPRAVAKTLRRLKDDGLATCLVDPTAPVGVRVTWTQTSESAPERP